MSKTEEKNEMVVTPTGNVPSFLQNKVVEDVGKGLSGAADDNLVPMVYTLQSNSPQVKPRDPDYIEGAKTGDIWLRNSGLPPIAGEEGMVFQPCYFSKDWVEWKPNRGGFVGRHLDRPADAEEKHIDPQNPDRKAWVRKNGNIVVETRYHVGRVYYMGMKMPYVIPMSGTGHTVSKAWMTRMNNKSMPGVTGAAPAWACLYRLKTKPTSNAYGDWMKFDIIDEGWVQSLEDYEAGASLNAAFAAGERGMETPQEEQGENNQSRRGDNM